MDYYDGLEAAEYAEMAADEAADTIAALRAEVAALRLERDAYKKLCMAYRIGGSHGDRLAGQALNVLDKHRAVLEGSKE